MFRTYGLVALAASGLFQAQVSAQAVPAQWRWQSGRVLHYRVEQLTTETDTVDGTKAETAMRLNLLKRWEVLAVDPAGVATVQQSLSAMRIERTAPSGTVAVFDSSKPDESDPQLQKQLSKYLGTPLAVLRIDCQGKVVEVKESKHVPASRYENELPFTVLLPAAGLQPGLAWERHYPLTLEPPLGDGQEKYPAVQKYACKQITGGLATITVTTLLKSKPEAVGDQVPLLQFLPQGEVDFDLTAGRLSKVRLAIDRELTGHQGAQSSYRIQSSYTEELVPNN